MEMDKDMRALCRFDASSLHDNVVYFVLETLEETRLCAVSGTSNPL
jgi:hypothetical protein